MHGEIQYKGSVRIVYSLSANGTIHSKNMPTFTSLEISQKKICGGECDSCKF